MLKVPNYPASCKSKRAAKVILCVLIVPNYPARGAARLVKKYFLY